eukprot:2794027-Rhodomonas_salina.1
MEAGGGTLVTLSPERVNITSIMASDGSVLYKRAAGPAKMSYQSVSHQKNKKKNKKNKKKDKGKTVLQGCPESHKRTAGQFYQSVLQRSPESHKSAHLPCEEDSLSTETLILTRTPAHTQTQKVCSNPSNPTARVATLTQPQQSKKHRTSLAFELFNVPFSAKELLKYKHQIRFVGIYAKSGGG